MRRCYGASGEGMAPSALFNGCRWSAPDVATLSFDSSRPLVALDQDSTIIAVIEMSQSKWFVATVVPGLERQPLKRLDAVVDTNALPPLNLRTR
jgi:transposase